jgi:hypothetical protein
MILVFMGDSITFKLAKLTTCLTRSLVVENALMAAERSVNPHPVVIMGSILRQLADMSPFPSILPPVVEKFENEEEFSREARGIDYM